MKRFCNQGAQQKRGDELALAARRVLFARSGKENDKIGVIGMADEMFRAVDDEVAAAPSGAGFHAAQVRARAGLGHRQAFGLLAAHGGQEVALPLLTRAGKQNIRWSRNADKLQRVARASKFLFKEHTGERIKAGAADFRGHVGSVEPRVERLRLEFLQQLRGQLTGVFELRFVRIKLLFDELSCCFDDEPLFVGEGKVHCTLTQACMGWACAAHRLSSRR